MQGDIEVPTAAANVCTQPAIGAGVVERAQNRGGSAVILAAQEDIALLRAVGVAGQDHAFDQQVRLLLHQQAILEGARLHFVGVADDIAARHVVALGGQTPLHAGREAGATASTQVGALHLGGQALVGVLLQRLGHRGVAAGVAILGEQHRAGIVVQAPGQRMGLGTAFAGRLQNAAHLGFSRVLGIGLMRRPPAGPAAPRG